MIVSDEIQKFKGVYMSGGRQKTFVDELLDFFVALTKFRHLPHVIVMMSGYVLHRGNVFKFGA